MKSIWTVRIKLFFIQKDKLTSFTIRATYICWSPAYTTCFCFIISVEAFLNYFYYRVVVLRMNCRTHLLPFGSPSSLHIYSADFSPLCASRSIIHLFFAHSFESLPLLFALPYLLAACKNDYTTFSDRWREATMSSRPVSGTAHGHNSTLFSSLRHFP